MALPTFNGFSLNDSTYITEKIDDSTRAPRRLESEVISRRIGKKLVNSQIQEKVIQISGVINAASLSDRRTAIDNLHKNVSGLEGTLVTDDDGRYYVATAERVQVPKQNYTQTLIPFDVQFVCNTPYAIGPLITVPFVIPSGTTSYNISTTISGSAPNRVTWRFTLPSGITNAVAKSIVITNQTTNNGVTVSGTTGLSRSLGVVFNYDRFNVTVNGSSYDYVGQMEEVDAGSVSFTVTHSGLNTILTGSLEYNPRYW